MVSVCNRYCVPFGSILLLFFFNREGYFLNGSKRGVCVFWFGWEGRGFPLVGFEYMSNLSYGCIGAAGEFKH